MTSHTKTGTAAEAELAERLKQHDAFYGMLLDKVRADRYPSSKLLDILEFTMVGYERDASSRSCWRRSPTSVTPVSR